MESDQDFYQIDFTTVSDWEIFVARIEEIISSWGLSSNNRNNNISSDVNENDAEIISIDEKYEWTVKTKDVTFKYTKFDLYYYRRRIRENENVDVLENMMKLDYDFKTLKSATNNNHYNHARYLIQRYGLVDFLALMPSAETTTLTSENDIRMIFSSFSVAINNVKCELPVFVRVLEPWQNYFLGFLSKRGVFSDYEMIHLKKIPSNCRYLNGLLNVFKSRLGASFISLDPVRVSIRFSYTLKQNWPNLTYRIEPIDGSSSSSSNSKFVDFTKFKNSSSSLPFGCIVEPISNLTLHATWPELLENVVVDSETYTDLEPQSAIVWSLDVQSIVEQFNCGALSSCVRMYVDDCCRCANYSSIKEFIGSKFNEKEEQDVDMSESLSKLTETDLSSSINKLFIHDNRRNYRKVDSPPIPNRILMSILYFLFPDADKNSEQHYSTFTQQQQQQQQETIDKNIRNAMKSCPMDGLVWRLGLSILHVMYRPDKIRSMSHLWYEFTQELRYRWENSILIPGVESTVPDYKTCLLNQKLQLLNCCIRKTIARENQITNYDDDNNINNVDNNNSEEEEFFDCQTTGDNISNNDDSIKNSNNNRSSWNQPVGRLRKYNDIRLINTGEYMYEPITQEIAPKTEDQLEEDAALLERLGTDAYASELRSKFMSVSLCSDMEAFKAANPDAVLEDFIRWYSPRDWIEQDEYDSYGQRKGFLSARMTLPGNIWREVWDGSAPVPASRQKRLFDDTAEAGKVLSFLETLNPAKAFRLLLASIVHIVVVSTLENCSPFSTVLNLESRLSELVDKAVRITRSPFDAIRLKEFSHDVARMESIISQYKSLEFKLFPDTLSNYEEKENILKRLIDGDEIVVPAAPGSELANRILIIFSQAKKDVQNDNDSDNNKEEFHDPCSIFPAPYQKQFILRARVPIPATSSRCLPQKMMVKISTDQILIASCFSRDMVYL